MIGRRRRDPKGDGAMPRDERRMTFVVVPHGGSGDLSTRSYEISYRTLRWLMVGGIALAAAIFLMAASWFWVAAAVRSPAKHPS